MTEATRPVRAERHERAGRGERTREETDQQIRSVARDLLVTRGRAAVTLRAIAREMGITAPALYRYYDSFDDLLQRVCEDICLDLAAELAADLTALPETDTPGRVFAVCRGFRSWAVRHPREFTLVFASPAGPSEPIGPDCVGAGGNVDPFGRIFLTVAGQVLVTRDLVVPADDEVPAALHADLQAFRSGMFDTLRATGLPLPEQVFSLGVAYSMLRFWVRLYGQVALEVFGRFPFQVSDPEALFEAMLSEMAAEFGLAGEFGPATDE
ncbi:MAG TPA: TetR/AcrR family transcriptional regulator [Pseudonocardiaceae bacterium]|jgi:AcrR family transcriptional regulator|nr:TetR/AcrR family transcriptional regulator [Pseudonocardiaceae bacterium]